MATDVRRREFERLFYSPSEAAQVMGITEASIFKLLNEGTLRAVRLQNLRRTLIPATELKRLAAETEPA